MSKNGTPPQPNSSQVCPACTCCCDDLAVDQRQDCAVANAWKNRAAVQHRPHVDGVEVEFETALAAAVQRLSSARFPLVAGLDGIATQAQQFAFHISRAIGGVIDTTFSNGKRAGMFAFQRHGKITATLGEVSQRADLVVFWFCDPAVTHPRLIERYCQSATQILVVDCKRTTTAERADQFVQIEKDDIYETLALIRMAISATRSIKIADSIPNEIASFAEQLRAADHGAFFYGDFESNSSQWCAATDALYLLTTQLNSKSRVPFKCLSLRGDANALSGENVLGWGCNYPFATRCTKQESSLIEQVIREPEFNFNEWSAESVLQRGECDAVLVCSSESVAALSRSAALHLEQTPCIYLLDPLDSQPKNAEVVLPVSADRSGGDWCRLDNVLLPLQNVNGTGPTAESVLQKITEALSHQGR